jgi:hypothetical protein
MSTICLVSVLLMSIVSFVSIAGQGAHGTHGGGCWRITPTDTLPDHDCDGLADLWETSKFYDENGDDIGVDLPLSVSPNHKDILVEIDTMVNHEDLATAIGMVKNKFLVAPVSNPPPDNGVGINLVVILDNQSIAHTSCTSIWPGFQSLKDDNFGTSDERAENAANIVSEKEDIFHYGVAIHSQCNLTGISGDGEQPGNDFVISLGDAGWGDSDVDGHPNGNDKQMAASLMHELGHNLDLKHGGSSNTPFCKPNYFSVMNHLYEFAGIVVEPIIGYSYTNGRDDTDHLLDENVLHEPHGIVDGDNPAFKGVVGRLSPPPPPASWYKTFTADGRNINYNYDGDSTDMNAIQSLNFFKNFNPPCSDTTKSVSYGFRDWPNIKYWDPPETKSLTKNVQLQTLDNAGTDNMILISSNTTANSSGGTSGSQQSLLNSSESTVLDDPSLTPCDLSDPVCTESPCDPDEPGCKTSFMINITDPSDPKMDIGNRTGHSGTDVSIKQIKNVTVSRILELDSLIQSELFANSTNQNNNTEILSSIHEELITDSDSVIGHIQSNNYSKAVLQLMKLQSLVLQTSPEKNFILSQIDEAIAVVRNLI